MANWCGITSLPVPAHSHSYFVTGYPACMQNVLCSRSHQFALNNPSVDKKGDVFSGDCTDMWSVQKQVHLWRMLLGPEEP